MRVRLRPLLGVLLLALGGSLVTTTEAVSQPRIGQLVAMRAASHATFDRVVWEFEGPLPERHVVTRRTRLSAAGSGHDVPIAGSTVLVVSLHGARAHVYATGRATAPDHLVPGMNNVVEVKQAGDFESVVTYGVGLVKDQAYRTFTLRNPSRVVLDINTDYRRAAWRVHFQHGPNYAAGREPYTVVTRRNVPAWTPAGAALHHLFAGPTAAERRNGLAVVRSGATGFTDLSIRDGVARVRLTGGCDSGGATYTIASHLMPTLKQFPSVRHVKIYDPQGRTARPTGHVDSVPACLEP